MSMRVLAVRYGSKRSVIAAGMRGSKGEQGEDGAAFQVDASGLLANRGAFDGEGEGFSYLATDTGDLYFRQGAAGNWSDPVPFQGPPGDSAYQIAVNNGFVGTEAEWLEALEGADGANGINGSNGMDGVSITSATINGSGHLLLTLSNSTVLDAGYVVGPAGTNGVDGVDGTNGVDGAPGADGVDGRGVASMAIDGSNHLIITYTDSATEDAGLIPGAGGAAAWGSIGGTLADQTDLVAALAEKVDAEAGKGLSSNDYTTTEKTKLAGIEGGAQVNAAAVSQAEAEAGTGTALRSWTVQRVWQAIAAWWAASAMKTKLDGIAAGATANATNAELRDRATHTGDQAISTITGLQTALDKATFAPVVTDSTTARTAVLGDAGSYLRFTNGAATAFTIPPQSSVAWPDGAEIHVRRAANANLTLTAGAGVTLTVPAGGTLVQTNAMSVTLKRVAVDVWEVIGQTVAA